MHPLRRRLIAVNVAGGIAVLGSYAYGLATHPDTRGQIWGGVPQNLQPLYTVSMLLAAAGYVPCKAFAAVTRVLAASSPAGAAESACAPAGMRLAITLAGGARGRGD